MRDVDLRSADVAGLSSTCELMEREWAPCRYNCPVHADVRAYVELVARGYFKAAIDVIRERLPFASVCGRICHHPCEDNCRRSGVDEAVAIREVKRFVAERQAAAGATVRKVKQDKARVAIVGSGPAGLAAGLDLAKLGYRPTAFEKFGVAGGICATAIPKYRLPRDVLQQDIDWICAHGVEIVTGVEIGRDRTIEELLAEGFRAVLIATGLSKSRMLAIPGSDNRRVYAVLEFLTDVAFGREVELGRDVLVIGGGNVAMDAARTAVRLGAARVRAMCLENDEEMPAWSWEKQEALQEGVSFIHRRGPVEVLTAGGRIKGLKHRKVTRVFDGDGRFAPEYDDSDVASVECDTVIMAIGQMADLGFVASSGLELDDRGGLKYDPTTHRTSRPEVFACGEIVTAPGSVVEACASGQRAARAMDLYLTGREIAIDDSLPPYIEEIAPATAEKVPQVPRRAVEARPAEVRSRDFDAIDASYTAEIAMREARRCMDCGGGAEVLVDKCAACLTCLRVCPFDIPEVTDVARISSTLCQACGMCIADCPANAIVARSWPTGGLVDESARTVAGMDGRRIVAYVCGHHSPAAAWSGASEDKLPGVAEIYLPSMARLGAAEILHALEKGADGVVVVSCSLGADRYPGAVERVRKRVGQVREMLAEIGIDPEKVQLVERASEGRRAMRQAMAEAAEKITASK
ncbi:MAG: FAD-dependent oxidoreductase [Planctomycetota bacterium]|jgi:NADPH-dependent glutamate synthase beta subunit-like oxidoreductase/coenzyme F420-reducing hydrogenase delta subunit